ncbi:MAG: bifunctional diaminohydroxyphosphoribosylaminopyrimidine deaminase/5-amino-6-(5-phosphoribosylamino)uracil reductase RibD, partial [candidate division WOR-3 bacterium]
MISFEENYIALTLKLAKKGQFFTSPNPHCGAVLVKGGKIIGKGYHKKFGGPHAEILAIESVKDKRLLKGATLYSLLEPCSHYGKTPPCTERIIREGIKEVVYAMDDPNPLVKGKEVLENAGIRVKRGVKEKEAKELNEWYIKYMKEKKPYVTLKAALTLDGKMATKGGESKWITGEKARDFSNLLRCEQDAILVGINTVIKDNPRLTCRRIKKAMKRVILDQREELEKKGVKVISVKEDKGLLSWDEILNGLYQLGCAKILIEGGARVFSSALKGGIVDKMLLFFAPKILGTGLSFTEKLSFGSLQEAIELKEGKV